MRELLNRLGTAGTPFYLPIRSPKSSNPRYRLRKSGGNILLLYPQYKFKFILFYCKVKMLCNCFFNKYKISTLANLRRNYQFTTHNATTGLVFNNNYKFSTCCKLAPVIGNVLFLIMKLTNNNFNPIAFNFIN